MALVQCSAQVRDARIRDGMDGLVNGETKSVMLLNGGFLKWMFHYKLTILGIPHKHGKPQTFMGG